MQKTFHNAFGEVFKTSLSVLRSLKIDVNYQNKTEGIISGETESTIWSWGELISIKLERKDNNTIVKINSESKAQLIDWGKNEKNEERIMQTITNSLK